MSTTESEVKAGATERRRNPMFGIVAILVVGIALMTLFATDEEPDEDRSPVNVTQEEAWEVPEVENWVIELFDGGSFAWLSDAGRLANEIRTFENYGPEYSRQDLERRDFQGENLPGATFRYVSLERANFQNANLEDAFFGLADLKRADFTGACLLNARFALLDLSDANFTGAYLVGTAFTMVQDQDADFSGATREGEEKCPEEV